MVGFGDLLVGAWLLPAVYGASSSSSLTTPSSSISSEYHQYTIPAAADEGANLIANIDDPEAIDAQKACPGYKASNVKQSANGVSATLKLAGYSIRFWMVSSCVIWSVVLWYASTLIERASKWWRLCPMFVMEACL